MLELNIQSKLMMLRFAVVDGWCCVDLSRAVWVFRRGGVSLSKFTLSSLIHICDIFNFDLKCKKTSEPPV